GATGRGEDVTYTDDAHEHLQRAGLPDLAGEYTFDSFSAALDEVDLWLAPPEEERFRHYRRWAVESAALDLALRQADTTLGDALDRTYDPVRFVVSTRLGEPPTLDRVERLIEDYPEIEFKLDPTPEWDADLAERLADTGRVRALDLKAHYEGTEVDQPPDPDLHRLVFETFPEALIEDPALTEETRPVVEENTDRVTWDVPITGVESVRSLPFEPEWLNCKPSRCGTVESLLEFVAHCEREGIDLYGGGQFELGVGRDQIQALAALFYPDGPNDVAPRGYNDPDPAANLPESPLAPPEHRRGSGV
ncbi:MAG: hypothetical protein ABEH35_03120, partial [Haloarculaceae archaeon]